jgi:MFS family permease
VTYVSVGFIIVFTAFYMTQNIAAKAMQDFGYDDLGFISQSCLFMSFSVTSLFCSSIVGKLGSKYSLVLAAVLRVVWQISFLIPATRYDWIKQGILPEAITQFYLQTNFIRPLMIVSGLVSGCGSAITWVAHGAYIAQCASIRNRGRFNGYAWIVLNISAIFGNFLGGFLISRVTYSTFYSVIPVIAIFAAIFLLGVSKPDPVTEDDFD